MAVSRGLQAGIASAILVSVLVLVLATSAFTQSPKVPAAVLNSFTSVQQFRLEISWTSNSVYEDKETKAQVNLNATARYVLKQVEATPSGALWSVQKPDSGFVTYTGVLINKETGQRTEWKIAGVPSAAHAEFRVGGRTPGYQLDAAASYPVKVIGKINYDTALELLTSNPETGPQCKGALPAAGNSISGAVEFELPIDPLKDEPDLPYAKVRVEYTLQPVEAHQ